jgi:hypothetical protein
MRKPAPAEFANAFMWLTVLAASLVLFWGHDRLWMMVVAMLVCSMTSMQAIARGCRGPG